MKDFFEGLWHGNLTPSENAVKFDKEYEERLQAAIDAQDELFGKINDEQKALFNKYYYASAAISSIEEKGYFEYGFMLGAQVMMKILCD